MLNDINFKSSQENVMIVLRVIDLDIAIRVAWPSDLTDQSSSIEKTEMERWDCSNHMSLMIMKRAIPKSFKALCPIKVTTADEFLEEIEKRIAKNEKAETSTLLANLISMRYKGKGNIREYIMETSCFKTKGTQVKVV